MATIYTFVPLKIFYSVYILRLFLLTLKKKIILKQTLVSFDNCYLEKNYRLVKETVRLVLQMFQDVHLLVRSVARPSSSSLCTRILSTDKMDYLPMNYTYFEGFIDDPFEKYWSVTCCNIQNHV